MYKTESGEILRYVKKKRIVVPSKKNNKKIVHNSSGKLRLVDSDQHKKWHKEHTPIFDQWHRELLAKGIRLPVVRCKVKVLFYFPDSADRDLSNKFETLADIMVDCGIIGDDTFKVMKPVYLDGWVQRERPRTEIYITIIDPTNPEYDWDITTTKYKQMKNKRSATRRKIKRDQAKQTPK